MLYFLSAFNLYSFQTSQVEILFIQEIPVFLAISSKKGWLFKFS